MYLFLSVKARQSSIIWNVLCRFHLLYHCCHSLSLIAICCHSLSLVVLLTVTLCYLLYHSLSLVVIPCHLLYYSLSLVVIRCHSSSFVVTRCTTRCHSLSFVVTRCHSLSLTFYTPSFLRLIEWKLIGEQQISLRILTEKKHPQMNLQRLQKVQIWAFGLLVQQTNSL